MITISNENKTRVDYLVHKQAELALGHLLKASTLLHDTGDVESEELDEVMTHVSKAVLKLESYVRYLEL